jgi:hypothetical protein
MGRYIEYLYNLVPEIHRDTTIGRGFNLYKSLADISYRENIRLNKNQTLVTRLQNSVNDLELDSLAGAIASVFILHQIAEELLHDVLMLTRFYMDLKLYPNFIERSPKEKRDDEKKLSDYISSIQTSISFEGKIELIQAANHVNKLRNEFAHDLLEKESEQMIIRDSKIFREKFQIFEAAVNGDGEKIFGVKNILLEKVKSLWKFSDGFLDVLRQEIQMTLDDENISYMQEEAFENTEITDR